ncbi:hypothetical protein [Aciduliprofundum sp. MAR08-339]|uniref:hypothetical protein n=1 Tax=Aciduliprofundum sp. (strain MAR08-339) TaxID=673860 RepID=UPI00308047BC
MRLNEESVLVLGIIRKVRGGERYMGAPRGEVQLMPGDELICYRPEETIKELLRRIKGKRGDREHREVVERVNGVDGGENGHMSA